MTRPSERSAACAGLLVLLLAFGGCTSDPAGDVGGGLVDPRFELDLVPLGIDTVADYSALAVTDAALPLTRNQVLYLGEEGGLASSILVNFDFGDVFTEDYPESLFTAENVKGVKFSLTMLDFYGVPRTADESVAQLFYDIHLLSAPFDTATTAWPGDEPEYGLQNFNADPSELHGKLPLIDMRAEEYLAWLAGGQKLGFIIRTGEGSEPGLVGFAARDLRLFSQLDADAVGTVVAPNFVVEFNDVTIPNYLMRPYADVSTFHQTQPAPADAADGLMLQTGLRSYPALRFDYGALPSGALINRAVLWVTCDSTASFGNLESIVVSELPVDDFGDPYGELTLSGLGAATYSIGGQTNLDPRGVRHLAFDVTTAVQRAVNGVYEGTRGLVLTAGEDLFPRYDLAVTDPDFYVTRFSFFGTAADDSLRPRLEITYSTIAELGGQP